MLTNPHVEQTEVLHRHHQFVEMDDTDHSVKMDDTDQSVKMDDTDQSVKMDDTDQSVKMDDTDQSVKMDDLEYYGQRRLACQDRGFCRFTWSPQHPTRMATANSTPRATGQTTPPLAPHLAPPPAPLRLHQPQQHHQM